MNRIITHELRGSVVLQLTEQADRLRTERDAIEVIGEALQQGAGWVLVLVELFDEAFFHLRTGIAGAIIQRFMTYRIRLSVAGDISPYLNQSMALRDFVYEANQGDQVWFVKDRTEFEERLQRLES